MKAQKKPKIKPLRGWRHHKRGTRPHASNEDLIRNEKREEELKSVMSKLESIGDPFDDMNIEEKKKHALYQYYTIIRVSFESLFS